MAKKIIVGIMGLAIVVAGMAAFSAFTAQMVNLEAHVEKEIELAVVTDCGVPRDAAGAPTGEPFRCTLDEDGGNFGTLVPQVTLDTYIELTLSKSFRAADQTRWGDVEFDVLWECKYVDEDILNNLTGEVTLDVDPQDGTPDGDGWPDCRVLLDDSDSRSLQGLLRDYLRQDVSAAFSSETNNNTAACLGQDSNNSSFDDDPDTGDPDAGPMQIEVIGRGEIDKGNHKCIFQIKLQTPVCNGSFNEFTDPFDDPKTIDCVLTKGDDTNIQTWERYADIGDEFKIQVTFHSGL